MKGLGKIPAVAWFEFLSTVTRKGYLFATFGMPLILLAYGLVITGLGRFIGNQTEGSDRLFGVVDRAAVLQLVGDVRQSSPVVDALEAIESTSGQSLPVGAATFRAYADAEAAHAELVDGRLDGYFLIPQDWLQSGKIEQFLGEGLLLNVSDVRESLEQMLLERLLAEHVDSEAAARIQDPVATVLSWTVLESGDVVERKIGAVIAGFVVPIGFTVLLFVAIFMNTGYLVQGTAVEKENKVVEVLLASARPDEILAGKLLGLGVAGLLQVAVWFSMLLLAALVFAALLAGLGVELPYGAMLAGIPFFAAGYLLFGALMLATGSLGASYKESQQYSGLWALFASIPMMFMAILLQDPGGTVAKVLTWIPFSAPVTVILRLALDADSIAWWEVAGSFLVLCLAIWLALRLGARLFRLGLLSGSRPKLREILRQARLSP